MDGRRSTLGPLALASGTALSPSGAAAISASGAAEEQGVPGCRSAAGGRRRSAPARPPSRGRGARRRGLTTGAAGGPLRVRGRLDERSRPGRPQSRRSTGASLVPGLARGRRRTGPSLPPGLA
eukprot:1573009-Alexandrium_andersonii.AAC.1